jgi:hypothetical protein
MMMWKGTGSSVALATVLSHIQQISAYVYQMNMTVTGQAPGVPVALNQQMKATILMSQDGGMKMTMNTVDPNVGVAMQQEMYLLPQKKTMLTLMPGEKKYMQIDLDGSLLEKTQKQNNDPRAMVKQLLICDYVNLGRSTINGVQVEGFETTDPKYGGGMGHVDVKMWVDVKTQLPVQSEMDMQVEQMHMHYVMDNFQWDVSVDPRELDPVIPADYTSMSNSPLKIPPMNEETVIQGLKLYAEISGRYPDELNVMTVSAKIAELAAKQYATDPNQASRDEKMKKLTDKTMQIAMAAAFYGSLVQGNKEPAYYGKTVTPQDVGQVLMRWKTADNEYRVIFGNLSAQTVKVDVLVQLEKALPQ